MRFFTCPASKERQSQDFCCGCLSSYQNPPDWEEILKYFRGSELQAYFQKVLEDKLKVAVHILCLGWQLQDWPAA